ncbi:hypothetical protein ACFQY4_00395 [Catellatospora bangladeshensis]|uniref:hypothetical protein n=1 Tax=Catellatospora bangladeshensis TaxID=310355 RepID=UPI0036224E5B
MTLITGDRLTVHGGGRISVTPRDGVTYHGYQAGGTTTSSRPTPRRCSPRTGSTSGCST